MKILGIECSGLVAGIAVTEDDNLLGEYTINYKKTHSQTILPMMDELAKMIELDFSTIDAIAVSSGPGSFTGLRIGSATAKGMGLALNKPIISVPTVDSLAYNLWGIQKQICPLMDARRQQAYTGLYTFADGDFQTLIPQCAVDIREIIEKVNQTGKDTIFLGDGVPVFKEYISEHVTVPYTFAPANCNRQRAANVAVLGTKLYENGIMETAVAHKPDYLRLSQAEREREQKERDFKIC
uniref:tRNA (adenosine(37)-N6)-threonylcarbamoyltransferase complex dimerization subunit type 1 TsaB n=1 Tax=Agathobacter sp. TaxID=2021311 RepID=UPI004056FB5A